MAAFYEDRVDKLLLWKRDTLNFLPHFHDSFEIVYITDGIVNAMIGGDEFTLKKGDLSIAMPNAIHSYTDEKNISAYVLIVPRRFAEAYSSMLDKNSIVTPVIYGCEEKISYTIEELFAANKATHPYKKQIMFGLFSILFGEIFAKTKLTECKKTPPETERRIILYCLENYKHDISLNSLSKELNISKNHISYIFSSKLKISMPDFIGALRVSEAKRLIETGMSMTDAALEAGFTSIRTFNRRFFIETGKTPREYAKEFSK